ncbi:predicted protein [Naegleria gruberi]|uniref:Predicted protein n=1 Tax=Naegleria gruberi TaxID=5762 RepID=D2VBK2_NAEGR|nr:uncharacterized protein NAEGRDRAFT_48223 [Naegleria gruberi]EFC45811.1 predicted protein [Naegleria gruberi]|eukprot:XP_002678555.1 predicted protein [Naegleria gruberi strain NEG-M]
METRSRIFTSSGSTSNLSNAEENTLPANIHHHQVNVEKETDPIPNFKRTVDSNKKISNIFRRIVRSCCNKIPFFGSFTSSNDESIVGRKVVEQTSETNFPYCKILMLVILGFLIASFILGVVLYMIVSRWVRDQAGDFIVHEIVRKGNLKHILQQVVDRVYLYDVEGDFKNPRYQLAVDTSHDGEFSVLVQHMLNNPEFENYEEQIHRNEKRYTIVDIGAHDCVSGSNSFNFIKMGFDAIVVEPSPVNMKLCKSNLERARRTFKFDQHHPRQRIEFVEAAITDADGTATLGNRDEKDSWGMQFFVDKENPNAGNLGNAPVVKTLKFGTFAAESELPKKFSVLSIDAEGQDVKILLNFLREGYKPLYLIYEGLHGTGLKVEVMSTYGYQLIGERGWNQIYVYRVETDTILKKKK